MGTTRPLRADAERSVRSILEAAERVLSVNPGASMEQIAEAAGVARTTVHRRFANRQALVEAMTADVVRQLDEVMDAGRPETAPPLVALHEITANVLRVKIGWPFAMGLVFTGADSPAAEGKRRVDDRCLLLLRRARADGLIDASADLDWVRRVFYALIGEAVHGPDSDLEPDALAQRVVDTLLHGASPRG
ncbi:MULTISPECIES: TetR/AcrR family transcriptional regulator [Saccharothrix]|uniref:TetR/AcrR family transcriptional regulator n=1 Tax=Saccharothrix TaxID=2071 RepID=UPI00116135C7|nr:TetR/AcrR family transcriptional regulator [Saccharothrix sp. CB00851]